MRPGACPAPLQAILTVLFRLVVLKIYGSTVENSRKAKVLAVPVGGLNGSVGCEKLEIHSTVAYVTTHASNLNTKSVEAQQEEEDEQCEVEEVSDQGFDEYTEITAPQMCPDKA